MPKSLEDALAEERSWTDGYYNAVRFYFWAPELLSKVTLSQLRKAGSKIERSEDLVNHFLAKINGSPGLERRTFEKLGRQEEPFNHQLEIFLRLAPAAMFDRLLTLCGLKPLEVRPSVMTRTVEQVWPGTQPDVLLLYDETAVAIEVKPPHGRSFEGQIAKYALLFQNIRRARPKVHNFRLLFLANGSFKENLPTRTPSLSEFKASEKKWASGRSRHAFQKLTDEQIAELHQEIDRLEPCFVAFNTFLNLANESMGSSETEFLLLEGIEREMRRRGYINNDC